MAKTSAFQADDAGSIPVVRSLISPVQGASSPLVQGFCIGLNEVLSQAGVTPAEAKVTRLGRVLVENQEGRLTLPNSHNRQRCMIQSRRCSRV